MNETPTANEMEAKLRSGYEAGYKDGYRAALNDPPYYCAFCDYYPPDTATKDLIQKHIGICPKHPLARKIAELEKRLEQLDKIQGTRS